MNQLFKLFVLVCLLLPATSMADDHQGSVKRAIVTSGIDNREPSDNLNDMQVTVDTNKVYFFTEVLNQANTNVTHRWFLNGKLEAEVVLKIGSNRWRTYSSKNLVPTYHSGNWQVEVVAQNGQQLASQNFQFGN
mgnify:FL=1